MTGHDGTAGSAGVPQTEIITAAKTVELQYKPYVGLLALAIRSLKNVGLENKSTD